MMLNRVCFNGPKSGFSNLCGFNTNYISAHAGSKIQDFREEELYEKARDRNLYFKKFLNIT